MQSLMAASAKGNQVQIFIVSLPAAQLLVVDLQVLYGTTDLAFPAIPTQYLFPEVFVELGDQAPNAFTWVEFGIRMLTLVDPEPSELEKPYSSDCVSSFAPDHSSGRTNTL